MNFGVLTRVRRVVRIVAAAVIVLLTFTLALVFGALLHLDLPVTRRLVVAELNGVLGERFKGKITIERLAHLGLFGVRGLDVTVTTADGTKVLVAKGVAARLSPLKLVKGALFGTGDRLVRVDRLVIDSVDIDVDSAAGGSLRLVEAFTPSKPSMPPVPGARPIAVDLETIVVEHAWAHGVIAGAPAVDVEAGVVIASFLTTSALTRLDVVHAALIARSLPRGMSARSTVEGHFVMPASSGATRKVSGTLDGVVGEIPLKARLSMDGDNVEGALDVPEVTAEALRASMHDVPVYQTASVHAEAHGSLVNLLVALDAHVGAGRLTVDGTAHVKGALGANVRIVASHIDGRAFEPGSPATDLGLRMQANAETRADGDLVVNATADLPVGAAAGQRVPSAVLRLFATERPGNAASPQSLSAHLEGLIHEPGMPVRVTADGTFRAEASTVTLVVMAHAPRLEEVKRLESIGAGSADLALAAKADIGEQTSFEADLTANARGFRHHGAHLESLHLSAKAHGEPTSPQIAARADVTGLAVAGYAFSRANVEAVGTLSQSRVAISAVGAGAPDVALRAHLACVPALTLSDVVVAVKREAETVRIGVESLRIEGNSVDATGIVVTGAGEPLDASVHVAPSALSVTASSRGLDLSTLSGLALPGKIARGTLVLDVDLQARRDRAKGTVALDLTEGAWSDVHGAKAHLGLALDGRRLTGALEANVGALGSIALSNVDVEIGGDGPLDSRSWRDAWGRMSVAARVDLARLAAFVPLGSLHIADVTGRATITGSVERDSLSDATPDLRLSLATLGFGATGQSSAPVREPGGPLMVGPAAWNVRGVDAQVDLVVDGADGTGELAVRLVGAQRALIALDLKTGALPIKDMFEQGGDLVAEVEALPLSLRVDLPEQEMGALPLSIRPDGLRGGLLGTLLMTGTLVEPVVDMSVTSRNVVARATPELPMDGVVTAHYDGELARINVDVRTATTILASGVANVHANARGILAAQGLPERWNGDVTANLMGFPIEALTAVSDRQVAGLVSGELAVSGLHENAKAKVNLSFRKLRMGKAEFAQGIAAATLDEKGLDARVRLEDPRGFLEARAAMGMTWGAAPVPVSDGTGLRATLRARHFDAAAAMPFASTALTELSGWIDADASVLLSPNQKPKMSGAITLTDGTVQAAAVAEAFHAVKAKVTLSEDGVVKLEDVEARGLSGRLTAAGSARLDGMTLLAADLALDVRKSDAIPLDIQGSNFGTVFGSVNVRVIKAPDRNALSIAVAVPHLQVALPSGSLPRSPERLGDAANVHLGVYQAPDRFLVLAVDSAPVKLVAEQSAAAASTLPPGAGAPRIVSPAAPLVNADATSPPAMEIDATIHLGDVQIVRGRQVAITLGGDLKAKVAAATTVRGEIRIVSGKVNVQGKEFAIEKGTVTFVGEDPSNPEVTATAGWGAPDGTKVIAQFAGPAKTGKVTLRSEPPRPKNEIVQLILFGTANGSESTPYASRSPSTGTQTGTAVGGLATDGLSKGLDQLTGLDVATKVDTSDASNPRADVELQITKEISLQLAYVIVQPPPATTPISST